MKTTDKQKYLEMLNACIPNLYVLTGGDVACNVAFSMVQLVDISHREVQEGITPEQSSAMMHLIRAMDEKSYLLGHLGAFVMKMIIQQVESEEGFHRKVEELTGVKFVQVLNPITDLESISGCRFISTKTDGNLSLELYSQELEQDDQSASG